MRKKVVKRICLGLLIFLVISILSVMTFFVILYNNTKLNISKLTAFSSGIKLYSSDYLDENENFSYNLDRKIVNIHDLHDYTLNAFIDIEDKRFYSHHGYDMLRILKSGLVNFKNKTKSQGASTITQQLIKNTLLSNEKTYKRKLKEIILSIKTEKEFSKDEIINMYLNTIYFGANAYGIENAAEFYFNKSASELTLNESAILSGIIKNPKAYSPKTNPYKCEERKNLVLKAMFEAGHIDKKEYESAKSEKVQCTQVSNNYENSYYQQAILEACELLNISEKELIRNNFQIITFLDKDVQNKINDIYSNMDVDADKLVIVANSKGEIIAYLGKSYFDLTGMKRMPASILKPLAVYLPSFIHNKLWSCSPILDEPIDFNGYSPKNADGEFQGWIDTKTAFKNSYNIPAVKILNSLGVDKAKDMLNNLGIETTKDDENLALALGSLTNGVSPLKLLEAYTIFQNYGKKMKLRFIDKILDEHGRVIYENNYEERKICDEEDAFLVTDMMIETAKSGTAKNLSDLGYEVASKTGTNSISGEILDLWNIAMTSENMVLSWLGDATNTGLPELSSSYHATNLSKSVLETLNNSKKKFSVPEKIVEKEIDLIEYEKNHKVVLAPDSAPPRYKKKCLFKDSYIPLETSTIFDDIMLEPKMQITENGVEIEQDINELYEYKIERTIDNKTETIASTRENTGTFNFCDNKIFFYDKVSYQIVAQNLISNKVFKSEIFDFYPKSYTLSKLTPQYNYNTKKRWYV